MGHPPTLCEPGHTSLTLSRALVVQPLLPQLLGLALGLLRKNQLVLRIIERLVCERVKALERRERFIRLLVEQAHLHLHHTQCTRMHE